MVASQFRYTSPRRSNSLENMSDFRVDEPASQTRLDDVQWLAVFGSCKQHQTYNQYFPGELIRRREEILSSQGLQFILQFRLRFHLTW